MKKRKAEKVYNFKQITIEYGGATYSCKGKAKYEIVDNGIASYEYWGSKETNHDYIAEFTDATVYDLSLEDSLEYGKQNLSEQDMLNIEDKIVSVLSEDVQLCVSLAEDI